MPWKVTCPVNERMKFVMRLEQGERLSDLCREFGISRKTGHKIKARFDSDGPSGLYDQSRAPGVIPHKTSEPLRQLIKEARQRHPTWGPKKIRAWLGRKHPGLVLPAASTIGGVLKQLGLVRTRRRQSSEEAKPTTLTKATAPNQVWCADFKGQFRLGNGKYCYPLTVTDALSRYIIACVALENTKGGSAQAVFEQAFREHGLPECILTDNGAPFASRGLAGLSKLSAWWVSLGIRPERIVPGHPEQNGRHERMHLTLKIETTRPAGANLLQQQERFDLFRERFNSERPHEALGQKTPSSVYEPSTRRYDDALAEPDYSLCDEVRKVSRIGGVRLREHLFYVGQALEGHYVGLREVELGRWLVRFMDLELGYFDEEDGFEAAPEIGNLLRTSSRARSAARARPVKKATQRKMGRAPSAKQTKASA